MRYTLTRMIFWKANQFQTKIKFILFIVWLVSSYTANSQSQIRITAGMNQCGFYGKGEDYFYNATYKHYVNYAASVSYKEYIKKKLVAGFELENVNVQSDLDIGIHQSVAYSYSYNVAAHLNYINLHFFFGYDLFSIKGTQFSVSLDPYFGYLVHAKTVGYGTRPMPWTYVDSLGVTQHIIWDQRYDVNETKLFRKSNIGLRLSLDISVPVNDKFAVLIKGGYDYGIYGVISESAFVGIRGYTVTAGIAYHLSKNYLRFNEMKSK